MTTLTREAIASGLWTALVVALTALAGGVCAGVGCALGEHVGYRAKDAIIRARRRRATRLTATPKRRHP